MDWLIETSWVIVLPIFLVGFAAHKLGKRPIAIGCWLIAIAVGIAAITEAPTRIASFVKFPDDQPVVWAEIGLMIFTGMLAFPVARFFLAGTSLAQWFGSRENSVSQPTIGPESK